MVTRNAAVKCCIRQLLAGRFEQTAEGIRYFLSGEKLAGRINLIAAVVGTEEKGSVTSLLLDDGTGQITARLFEMQAAQKFISFLSIGKIVLIIGKMRLFNQERYLSPEIIKPIPAGWILVRKKELGTLRTVQPEAVKEGGAGELREELIKEDVEAIENMGKVVESGVELPRQKILELIKAADFGEGALVEDIVEQFPFSTGEEIISSLRSRGVIFEITPGRVKIL